jgi:PleD family two-component response regulator
MVSFSTEKRIVSLFVRTENPGAILVGNWSVAKPMTRLPSPVDTAQFRTLKRVAIVDGSVDLLAWLEPILDPGGYEVQFLDAGDSPFTVIRLAQPDLVVLTLRIEDLESFTLLSMLKLDPETSHIQVLTYSTEFEGQQLQHTLGETADERFAARMPALPLN